MAFTSRGGIGTNQGSAAASNIVLTPGITISAGNLAVVCIGADNSGTADGDNSEVTAVTDSSGNTWTKAREHTNGNAAASAGTMVSMWYCKPTTNLTAAAATITATFTTARNARTINGWAWTIGSSTPTVAASTATAVDAAQLGTCNLATALTSREYLFVRADAAEGDITGYTPTAGYTSLSWVTALVGGSFGNFITLTGEHKIATTTSAMSTGSNGFGYDNCSILVAFYESAAAAGVSQLMTRCMTGVGL